MSFDPLLVSPDDAIAVSTSLKLLRDLTGCYTDDGSLSQRCSTKTTTTFTTPATTAAPPLFYFPERYPAASGAAAPWYFTVAEVDEVWEGVHDELCRATVRRSAGGRKRRRNDGAGPSKVQGPHRPYGFTQRQDLMDLIGLLLTVASNIGSREQREGDADKGAVSLTAQVDAVVEVLLRFLAHTESLLYTIAYLILQLLDASEKEGSTQGNPGARFTAAAPDRPFRLELMGAPPPLRPGLSLRAACGLLHLVLRLAMAHRHREAALPASDSADRGGSGRDDDCAAQAKPLYYGAVFLFVLTRVIPAFASLLQRETVGQGGEGSSCSSSDFLSNTRQSLGSFLFFHLSWWQQLDCRPGPAKDKLEHYRAMLQQTISGVASPTRCAAILISSSTALPPPSP